MTGRRVAQVDRADAVQRAFRTLWQSVGIDTLAAVGVGLVLLLDGGDVLSPLFWAAFGVLIVRSFLTALAAFLARLRAAPKPLPATPLPEPDPLLTDEYHESVARDRQAIYPADGKE